MIPKFQTVELFLFNCLTHLGIPSDMKRTVNPNNKTISKLIAVNNSIKKRESYPSNLDQLSINSIMAYTFPLFPGRAFLLFSFSTFLFFIE